MNPSGQRSLAMRTLQGFPHQQPGLAEERHVRQHNDGFVQLVIGIAERDIVALANGFVEPFENATQRDERAGIAGRVQSGLVPGEPLQQGSQGRKFAEFNVSHKRDYAKSGNGLCQPVQLGKPDCFAIAWQPNSR